MRMLKSKKGVLGAMAIFGIIVGALFLFNIIGIASITHKLSSSPLLIVAVFIGLIILMKR